MSRSGPGTSLDLFAGSGLSGFVPVDRPAREGLGTRWTPHTGRSLLCGSVESQHAGHTLRAGRGGAQMSTHVAEAKLTVEDKSLTLPAVHATDGADALGISACSGTPARSPSTPGTPTPARAGARSPSSTARRASCATAATRSRSSPRSARSSRSPTCSCTGELPTKQQLRRFTLGSATTRCCTRTSRRLLRLAPEGRAPDGRVLGGGRRARDLLPGLARPARRAPGRDLRAPAASRRCRRSPPTRSSTRSASRSCTPTTPRLRRELPADDVRDAVRGVRGRPGRREGDRPAPDPARRPRAELLDAARCAWSARRW